MKMQTSSGIGLVVLIMLMQSIGLVHADVVTDWNGWMQKTIASSNPFVQSRNAAITQLAVFEAVNSITGTYHPYLGAFKAPPGASAEAAAVAAAHRALVTLYPASAPTLDAARASSLAAIADGDAKDVGVAIGETAANAMVTLRSSDGWNKTVAYIPGSDPGDYQPTPPAFASPILVQWGNVKPFGIANGSQFRSSPPPQLASRKYARSYREVKAVGSAISTERPQVLSDIANFYVTSAVQIYNAAARQVATAQGKSLSQNAHDFALLDMAIADALISAMETKYFYNLWRPVTAIRAGDSDGNPHTDVDATWLPLIATPAFPSYPSAHASAGGAAREVLERLYGEDGLSIVLTAPTAPGVTLHYTTWEQITDDVDDARVYGGIHFRFDQEARAKQGRKVGAYILRKQLGGVEGEDGEDEQ